MKKKLRNSLKGAAGGRAGARAQRRDSGGAGEPAGLTKIGAGRISMKSYCLGPQLLSDYAFLHYNYKYDWLRPTLEEIVDT